MKKLFLTYGTAVGLAVLAFLVREVLFDPRENGFGFFYAAVALSASLGGIRTGLVTVIASILLFGYFSVPELAFLQSQSAIVISIIVFFLEGAILSQIIDWLKRTDVIGQYQKRESELEKLLTQWEEKYSVSLQEIKARDEFLSIASHELKTPLTSMLLQLQAMLYSVRNVSLANFSVENMLKMLESAQNQTTRLSKMIGDLLNVSLITTKKLDLELEEVDLAKLTKGVVESFEEKIKRDGVKVQIHADSPVVGKWDKYRVEQVVTNLVSNALKYGDGKPVEIKVANHGGSGKVIVRDQGIGIADDQKAKIFALFERAAPVNGYKGLGVGLYISEQIVKAHGGKIMISGDVGKGSTFTVELPIQGTNGG